MATDRLFFGIDTPREWLEDRRAVLLKARADGKRITMVLAAGVKTESKVEVNVRVALYEVEHDLCVRYPQQYPPAVLMPIRRTRPRYLFGA